jgi:hypothetical protein
MSDSEFLYLTNKVNEAVTIDNVIKKLNKIAKKAAISFEPAGLRATLDGFSDDELRTLVGYLDNNAYDKAFGLLGI